MSLYHLIEWYDNILCKKTPENYIPTIKKFCEILSKIGSKKAPHNTVYSDDFAFDIKKSPWRISRQGDAYSFYFVLVFEIGYRQIDYHTVAHAAFRSLRLEIGIVDCARDLA